MQNWPLVSACHAGLLADHRTPVGSVRFLSARSPTGLMCGERIRPFNHFTSSYVSEPRWQQALPLGCGFDPFGSASEQMCSVASARRHVHICLDVRRSQHKGKNIFISLEVLVFERIIQLAITPLQPPSEHISNLYLRLLEKS